jgi:hypothetical protein
LAVRLHLTTPFTRSLEQLMADKLDNSAPFDDDQGTRIARKPTGAGAEAAEGIHGDPKHRDSRRNPGEKTSVADGETAPGEDRSGSEPFDSNSHEHLSGYGGKGGAPKQSNDGSPSKER